MRGHRSIMLALLVASGGTLAASCADPETPPQIAAFDQAQQACGAQGPLPETCDGVDNDCDGLTDRDDPDLLVDHPCGVGACAAVLTPATQCSDGAWAECPTELLPAGFGSGLDSPTCDGVDDDCDGETDENFVPEDTVCGTGPCSATGVTSCSNGLLADSCEELDPVASDDDTCDDVDDDCDGEADEDVTYLDLANEAPALLSKGDACGTGVCAGGTVVCKEDGNAACSGSAERSPDEVCDGQDDDCDGETDEGFPDEDNDDLADCVDDDDDDDGVLDVCDVDSLPDTTGNADCDDDGTIDSCQIAAGEVADCNQNSVPDACDLEALADGVVKDCDHNGVPDTCDPGGVSSLPEGPLVDNGSDSLDHAPDIGPGLHGVDTTLANTDGVALEGEPPECDEGWKPNFEGGSQVHNDVWYSFTATANGTVKISLCEWGGGVDFDVRLAVYHDTDGAPATAVACNDDVWWCWLGADLNFDAVAGERYTIRVGGFTDTDRGSGHMYLAWLCNDCDDDPDVYPGAPEYCDSKDNDCDGEIDVDCCANCDCSDPDVEPYGSEICDSKDNDCDGKTDEGCGADCDPDNPLDTVDTTCDGVDDDCDGPIDEDYPSEQTTCGLGVCTATGLWTCLDAVATDTCVEGQSSPTDSCDGLDNDCDGETDEDYLSGGDVAFTDLDGTAGLYKGDPCGVGACDGGVVACAADALGLACSSSGQAGVETCNALDDDCDGGLDEGFCVSDGGGCLEVGEAFPEDPCIVCGVGGVGLQCEDDGDPCTIGTCDDEDGCVVLPAPPTTPCDDGDEGTLYDACTEDGCAGVSPQTGPPIDQLATSGSSSWQPSGAPLDTRWAAHTCALRSGVVRCWGSDYHGQQGTGDGQANIASWSEGTDVALPGSAVTHIGAGAFHTCAVIDDDEVYCWGNNEEGQVGAGYVGGDVSSPLPVFRMADPIDCCDADAATCSDTPCAELVADYVPGCAADNWSTACATVAMEGCQVCASIPLSGVAEVTGGYKHSCARTQAGSVWCWGTNYFNHLGPDGGPDSSSGGSALAIQVPLGEGVSATGIAAGSDHTCVITTANDVRCWGVNWDGRLGSSTTQSASYEDGDLVVVDGLIGVTPEAIGAGHTHTCVLGSWGGTAGRVWCWGEVAFGKLGVAAAQSVSLGANAVSHGEFGGTLSGALDLAVGDHHSCVVTADDTIRCWGANALHRLGRPSGQWSFYPVEVLDEAGEPWKGRTPLAVGRAHTCAVGLDGAPWCWGYDSVGQLGRGTEGFASATPVRVAGLTGVTDLDLGGTTNTNGVRTSHVCAVYAQDDGVPLEGGRVTCWGANPDGQLGLGADLVGLLVDSPRWDVLDADTGMPLEGVVDVGCATHHCCAALADGGVRCWGNAFEGDPIAAAEAFFVPVAPGSSEAASIDHIAGAASTFDSGIGYSNHICAVGQAGGVWCWGGCHFSACGIDDYLVELPNPVPLGAADAVATGSEHACALVDGGVWCWGRDSPYSVLGAPCQGISTSSTEPVQVESGGSCEDPTWLQGATGIAAGDFATCALVGDTGELWCWGYGYPSTPSPVTSPVGGTMAVSAVDLGYKFACAILADSGGQVVCWGEGGSGQMGDGQLDDNAVPAWVDGLSGATGIATGYQTACAIVGDAGEVWCWGSDYAGDLGFGRLIGESPARVVGYLCADGGDCSE